MSEPLSEVNVAIVGFGRIGAEHAGWMQAAKGVRAVAVYDPTPARQKLARSRRLRSADSMESLLNDSSIDVVLISTPTAMHHAHTLAALRAQKHVMVEKPMALDLPQSRELVQVADQQKKVLSVFHCRRWDIDYLTVKSAIDAGVFGKVINVESRIGQWASCVGPAAKEWHPSWRNEASFGGGGLYDWGSHFVDQIWQLMQPAKPIRVFAQLRGNVWSRDCDDFARVLINFDNGAVGLVEINTTTTRSLPRWHIDGTKGSADAPFSPAFDLTTWSELTFTPSDSGAPPHLLPKPKGDVLTETAIWERFATAVRGESDAAVTAASVLTTMRLLDAARQSSQLGTAVDVSDRSR